MHLILIFTYFSQTGEHQATNVRASCQTGPYFVVNPQPQPRIRFRFNCDKNIRGSKILGLNSENIALNLYIGYSEELSSYYILKKEKGEFFAYLTQNNNCITKLKLVAVITNIILETKKQELVIKFSHLSNYVVPIATSVSL